jgi:hypothetical protein
MGKYEGHTPGPWRAEQLDGAAGPNERPWVRGATGYAALACGDTQAEAVANARLIADAPKLLRQRDELLEALRAMLSEFVGPYEGGYASATKALATIAGIEEEDQ